MDAIGETDLLAGAVVAASHVVWGPDTIIHNLSRLRFRNLKVKSLLSEDFGQYDKAG